MAKRPNERFASASKAAELLEGCLAHVQQPTAVALPEPVRDAEPSPRTERSRWSIGRRLAGAAFALVVLLAGLVVVLELNKGTLTIESEADNASLRITQGDTVVEKLTVTRAGKKLRIAAGTYVVEIEGEADGIAVENEAVTLERGGAKLVRIVRRSHADHPAEREQPPTALGPLSHRIPFEVGATWLQGGDRITIEEVRGTADSMKVGNMYEIRGTYRLDSRGKARLSAYITSDGTHSALRTHYRIYSSSSGGIRFGDDRFRRTHERQSMMVERGEGRFRLFLYMGRVGKPHVSFYPEGGGEGFGHVYFGTGDSVLKKGWWEAAGDEGAAQRTSGTPEAPSTAAASDPPEHSDPVRQAAGELAGGKAMTNRPSAPIRRRCRSIRNCPLPQRSTSRLPGNGSSNPPAGAPANFPLLVSLEQPALGPECTRARREAMLKVLAERPAHPPGEKHVYSNVGYTIAGAMAERTTDMTWEDLVKREVFEPLELTGAGFGPPKSTDDTLEQPRGHSVAFGWKFPMDDEADNTPIIGPAGSVHMTLRATDEFPGIPPPGLPGIEESDDALSPVVLVETLDIRVEPHVPSRDRKPVTSTTVDITKNH